MPLPLHPSPLEVTVTPAQSSFFAGEELRCLITFTNRNIPIPASQPLPSTSRFPGSLENSFSRDRRTTSDRDVLTATPPPHGHAKSQSFDGRSPASRNGKQRQMSGGMGISEEAEHEEEATLFHYDLAGNVLPTRKRIIGKNALPFVPSPAGRAYLEKKHSKSASMAAYSTFVATPPSVQVSTFDSRNRVAVGIGFPTGSASRPNTTDTAFPSRYGAGATETGTPQSVNTPNNGRRLSTTIQADHPHSRKKSVMQVQHEDLSAAFELSNGTSKPLPSAAGNNLRSASYEDVTLPGAYQMSPSPSRDAPDAETSFYNLGRNDTMESVVRDQLTSWSRGGLPPSRRTSVSSVSGSTNLPGIAPGSSPLFPQRGSIAPGTETILWSFAQFSGSYEVDESLIKPGEFEDVKRRLAYGDGVSNSRSSGTSGAIGGGDLGHEENADVAAATSWATYLRSALGGVGGGTAAPSRHRRTGSTMLEVRQKTMTSKTIPTFSSPPSIVAVDLNLLPNESKTYSFTMQLPNDLPPSYFGKAIKFTYELVIGTNRVDSRKSAAKGGNQRSRLIKIPLRVYNHVDVTGVKSFFDLTNPVVLLTDAASIKEEETDLQRNEGQRRLQDTVRRASIDSAYYIRKTDEDGRGRQDLQRYARSLLASSQNGEDPTSASLSLKVGMKNLSTTSVPMTRGGSRDSHMSALPRTSSTFSAAGDDDVSQSCKGAIEVLTRNSHKVSYDIAKDGELAAVLTLVKSKYRLGDSILGVVNINRATAVARVVRIAAVLESYEEIEASLGTLPAGRMQRATRKVHAEHHDSTLDAGQASFSLPIPSGATPDFSTSGVKLHWTVRLSFLTQVAEHINKGSTRPAPPPHLHHCPDGDGFSLYHSRYRAIPRLCGPLSTYFPSTNGEGDERFGKDAKLEIVECAVPVTVLPNSTSFKPNPVSFAA